MFVSTEARMLKEKKEPWLWEQRIFKRAQQSTLTKSCNSFSGIPISFLRTK